jgi:hypothetical protein
MSGGLVLSDAADNVIPLRAWRKFCQFFLQMLDIFYQSRGKTLGLLEPPTFNHRASPCFILAGARPASSSPIEATSRAVMVINTQGQGRIH